MAVEEADELTTMGIAVGVRLSCVARISFSPDDKFEILMQHYLPWTSRRIQSEAF